MEGVGDVVPSTVEACEVLAIVAATAEVEVCVVAGGDVVSPLAYNQQVTEESIV